VSRPWIQVGELPTQPAGNSIDIPRLTDDGQVLLRLNRARQYLVAFVDDRWIVSIR
jgi:uncharacterized protein (DUF1684 family)